jgi:hypothetical protein
MTDIKPRDLSLLTDDDVEYAHFKCCEDEDLVFLHCSSCGHIWVLCYECETCYTDLRDLTRTECCMSEQVNNCPHCGKPFAELHYLTEVFVDKYLPTAQQVIDAGLAKHLREKHGIPSH